MKSEYCLRVPTVFRCKKHKLSYSSFPFCACPHSDTGVLWKDVYFNTKQEMDDYKKQQQENWDKK